MEHDDTLADGLFAAEVCRVVESKCIWLELPRALYKLKSLLLLALV